MPEVGILIPTYRRSEYLAQALQSAVRQTHPGIEIIVIDNGQSDVVRDTVDGFNDPRLRYVRNESDIQLTGSIRKGVQQFSSKVTWITVLPDDDLLDVEYVSEMMGFIEHQSDASIVHGHRVLIDAEGSKTGETSIPPAHESALEFLLNRALFIRETFLGGTFFSRAAYDAIGGYPQFATGMATDDALIFSLAMDTGLFFNPNAITSIRQYPEAESQSSSNASAHIQAFTEYHAHVITASRNNETFSEQVIKAIEQITDHFVRQSISGQWLSRIHALSSVRLPESGRELSALHALPAKHPTLFTPRVKLSAFLASRFGCNPEGMRVYRLLADYCQRSLFWLQKINLRRQNA